MMQLGTTTDLSRRSEACWRLEDEDAEETRRREREFEVQEALRKIDGELSTGIEQDLMREWTQKGHSPNEIKEMLELLRTLLKDPV